MTRLRRRPRAAYRVYGEEEYLAGADALPVEEHARPHTECPAREPSHGPSHEPAHGRRLQRIAGAAALTGTVGAIGGIVGLAGSRTHAHALDRRELAQRTAPPARPARIGARSGTRPAGPSLHAAHRRGHGRHPLPRTRMHQRRRIAARASLGTASPAWASVRGAPTKATSAAQSAPPASAARPAAQSEFGFER